MKQGLLIQILGKMSKGGNKSLNCKTGKKSERIKICKHGLAVNG